jgi:hypothetical protein
MENVTDIINRIGKPRIRAAYGVGDRILNRYIQDNRLPAAWFDGLEKMTGQALPRNLFTFKEVAK